MATDKHQGKGGTFIVSGDERHPATPDKDGTIRVGDQVLHRPQTRPHPEGDGPRSADGKRSDLAAAREAAKPQPAMPLPSGTPPWATPATQAEEPKKTEKKESK